MENLLIEIKSSMTGMFGVTPWTDNEYSTPLKLNIKDAEVEIFIEKPSDFYKEKFSITPTIKYNIMFKNASKNLIKGINCSNQKDTNLAVDKIYAIYEESNQLLESLLISKAKVENLITMGSSVRGLFGKGVGSKVYYSINNGSKKVFTPKLPKSKGINPLYSSRQLVTFEKWKKMQQAIDSKNIPLPEIDELLRIKAKLLFIDSRKFAVLESIILIEYALGKYVEKHLSAIGLPRKKVKDYGSDLTLNTMLNIILPITLRKTHLKRMNAHISNVNNLRKIRNKIMHEKTTNSEIDSSSVKKGIDSSIKLMEILST